MVKYIKYKFARFFKTPPAPKIVCLTRPNPKNNLFRPPDPPVAGLWNDPHKKVT
jgi:hypothetical protein